MPAPRPGGAAPGLAPGRRRPPAILAAVAAQPDPADLAPESDAVAAIAAAPTPAAAVEAAVRQLARRPGWDWVGVYLLAGDTLVLGPFVGPPTEHVRIRVGDGVCGTAVAQGRDQVVDDVRERGNYLACSAATRSELVVLIEDGGEVVGEFDVDSDAAGTFGAADAALLRRLAVRLGAACRRLRDELGAGGAPTATVEP